MTRCTGASAKRTVETFASMLGWNGLHKDKDGRSWTGAAEQLYQRSADVKKAIAVGADVNLLHAALSRQALQSSAVHGTGMTHSTSGECQVCETHFPREYAALKPQIGKRGRPPKKKRERRSSDAGEPHDTSPALLASLRRRSTLATGPAAVFARRSQTPLLARHWPLATGRRRSSRSLRLVSPPRSLHRSTPLGSSPLRAARRSPLLARRRCSWLAGRRRRVLTRRRARPRAPRRAAVCAAVLYVVRGDYTILHTQLTGLTVTQHDTFRVARVPKSRD